jgi:hypothetical protein
MTEAARSRDTHGTRGPKSHVFRCLHVDHGLGGPVPPRTESLGGPFLKLGLPLHDLVRVNVKMLSQLVASIPLDGNQCHLRLESRRCRRARLLIVSPDLRANLARRQAEIPLIALCRFSGTGSVTWGP